MFILVGLGNPGEEYETTRHNTGAMVLDVFRKTQDFPEWALDTKRKALTSEGSVSSSQVKGQRSKVLLLQPQTFMNKSGESLKNLPLATKNLRQGKKKIKEIPNLVVLHDDLDIPFGKFKISFDKSSGGHRGVESIIRTVKTRGFTRVRIGIAQSQAAVAKSQDDKTVEKIILGKFTPDQITTLKKMAKFIAEGLSVLITEGREKAMSQYHS